jgi:hypothetical protein
MVGKIARCRECVSESISAREWTGTPQTRITGGRMHNRRLFVVRPPDSVIYLDGQGVGLKGKVDDRDVSRRLCLRTEHVGNASFARGMSICGKGQDRPDYYCGRNRSDYRFHMSPSTPNTRTDPN